MQILVAFATQSLIAVFVSCYTYLLTEIIWYRCEGAHDLGHNYRNERWMKADSPHMLIRVLACILGENQEFGGVETPTEKRLTFGNRILLAVNDSQTFTGKFCSAFLGMIMILG
jgi:hypothetical protein